MSQLIELIWRNKSYVEGTRDAADGYPQRKGAMFAGFKTEMGFDNMTGKPIKKTRQEYAGYDRVCVYPGLCRDGTHDYNIGPQKGVDPSSIDLPMDLQIPRTIPTEVYEPANQLDRVKGKPSVSGTLEHYQNDSEPSDASQLDLWRSLSVPYNAVGTGMMIRKRSRFTDDSDVIAPVYAKVGFVDDLNYANAGDTTVSIDLNESISGVGAVLKKVVVQCSKTDHHISEVVLDFSDITRASGSISSSENPQANLLTILMDGHERVHTAYFDCKMGKFSASKFQLGVKSIKYFPPMGTPAGGFDPGSQVAVPGDVSVHCEKHYHDASATGTETTNRATTDVHYSLPNAYRSDPKDSAGNTLVTGARMVADAVNAGYHISGSSEDGTAKTSADDSAQYPTHAKSSLTELSKNTTQTLATAAHPGVHEITRDVSVAWSMPGVSSYTFKPRQPRGSVLAISIVLQADANMF